MTIGSSTASSGLYNPTAAKPKDETQQALQAQATKKITEEPAKEQQQSQQVQQQNTQMMGVGSNLNIRA